MANIYWVYKADIVYNIYWTILLVAYHRTRVSWKSPASWTPLPLAMCIYVSKTLRHGLSFYGLILQKENLFTKSSITKASLKYKLLPWFLPINTLPSTFFQVLIRDKYWLRTLVFQSLLKSHHKGATTSGKTQYPIDWLQIKRKPSIMLQGS